MREFKLNKRTFDAAAIGSALVDVTVSVSESMLDELHLKKGSMHLIDENLSGDILRRLEGTKLTFSPGGSAANTIAGVKALGGSGLFIGSVGDDRFGRLFADETKRAGVKTGVAVHNGLSGHAITFITPDGERTFATHLGAAEKLCWKDISRESILSASVLHIEGYIFELNSVYDACIGAMETAASNGTAVSIDLSDSALIKRIYDRMERVVKDFADIVFANEEEACAFTRKQDPVEALNDIAECCSFAVLKRGAGGSVIKTGGKTYYIPAVKVDVINTNGAGDMYAAGIVYSLSRGFSPDKAGRLASASAALIAGQAAARSESLIDTESLLRGGLT